MPPPRRLRLRAHLEARTRFFDAQVLSAMDQGIGQVVVLGAGYDDRPLRFRAPGVHFFEVDHPVTQADKRRRLERMGADCRGVTLASADFRVDPVDSRARALRPPRHPPVAGAGRGAPGLPRRGRHPRAAERSPSPCRTRQRVGGQPGRPSRRGRLGVRWWLGPTPPARGPGPSRGGPSCRRGPTSTLVARSGWRVVESVDDAALGTGAAPGRSLLVVAHPGPDRRHGLAGHSGPG